MINPAIDQYIQQNDGVITTAEALALGFSKTILLKYVQQGQLERVAHGVYMLPGEMEDELYLLSLRSQKMIFSHDTALFLCGLSDRTPFNHSATIPSNAAVPASIKDQCIWYYIKPNLHSMGAIQKTTTFGHSVRCYNPERTLCDLLRSRSRCSEETVLSAVKNYSASKAQDLNLLAEYADQLNVTKALKRYLEVLL